MKLNSIRLSTRRSNIVLEMDDMEKPLTSVEIKKQAEDLVGDENNISSNMTDQMKKQQEMEKQMQTQKERMLMPQMKQLQQSMHKLNVDVLQGKQATETGDEKFDSLEKEMTNINSLIGNLQKQI